MSPLFLSLAAFAAPPGALDFELPGVDRDRRFEQPVLDASTEIINGEREARYGAVVALAFPQIGIFCTASMITPRVALTAGHCVLEGGLSPALIEQFATVRWGARADDPYQTANILRVIPHPNFAFPSNGTPTGDLALIEIEPVEYTDTVWINEDPIPESVYGSSFFSAGYGLDEQRNNGVLKSAEVILGMVQGEFLLSDTTDNPGRGGICSGDSGGPMYGYDDAGRLREYGVHSWGVSQDCRGLSASTSTAEFANFIRTNVEAIHGSADMCENRGANTDVVCDPECPDDVICAALEAGAAKSCQTGGSGAGGTLALFGLVLAALGRRRTA